MANVDKKDLFENYPVGKAIRIMAVPTIISQLINLIYNIVDTFYIGRTGNSYMIAGVSVSFTLFVMCTAFSNLPGIGGGSQVARLMGQGQKERANKVSSFSILLGLLISVIYVLFLVCFLNPVLKVLGASENSMVYARQYVTITVIIGGIPTIMATTIAHLLRNSGNSKQASFGLSGGGILNIILDPIFMFVIMPDGYEVVGAALATCISNCFSFIYLYFQLVKRSKEGYLNAGLKAGFAIDKDDKKTVFTVGVPATLLTTFYDVANMVLNALGSGYGDFVLAAIGISMKIERLPSAIGLGIAQGALPVIAYNYSSKNYRRMKEVISTARKTGLLINFICIAFLQITANSIVKLFVNTNTDFAEGALTTIAYASVFLRIRCLGTPIMFLNYQSSFSFQALGDGKTTLLHCFMREFVFYIPFMLILNRLFGMYGLIAAIIAGEGCGAVIALILMRKRLNLLSENAHN